MRTSRISEILRAELFDPFLDAAFANNARDAEYLISDKPPTVPEQSHIGPVRWP
jgi:hypothetical protein